MPFTSETARLHRGPGGRRRKTHPEVVAKKAVAEIAQEYIETHLAPVFDNYVKLAKGWFETRYTDDGVAYEAFCYDGPSTRHFVDKVLPTDQSLNSGQTLNIFIAQATKAAEPGFAPELRGNGIQVRIGGDNGQNGNGSNGA